MPSAALVALWVLLGLLMSQFVHLTHRAGQQQTQSMAEAVDLLLPEHPRCHTSAVTT
jgi:hypothetical protein